jgi:hypothetical protein
VFLRALVGEQVYDVLVLPSALDALDAAIAGLDLAVDDRDLAAVLALRDRLDARIATAVQAVDAASLWDTVGATSMTAWVTDRGRMAGPGPRSRRGSLDWWPACP